MCIEKNFPRVTVWHQKALPCDVNDHGCMMPVYRKNFPRVTVWHQKALPCDVNDHGCMMPVYRKNFQGLLTGIRRLCLVMLMIIGV